MNTTTITTSQYATRRKVSRSAVQAAVKKAYDNSVVFPYSALPGVTNIEVFGSEYMITVTDGKITKGRISKYATKLQR